MIARATPANLRSTAATLLGATLCGAPLIGCGPYPDLKVTVTAIPADATQLSVILWKSAPVPSNPNVEAATPGKDIRVFDLPNPAATRTSATRDFSFGLLIDTPRSISYQVNVAAWSPTARPCLRITTAGVQPANFSLESSVMLAMPPSVEADLLAQQTTPMKRCYGGPLAEQTAPLIAGVGVEAQWLSDASVPGMQDLVVRGWNFHPQATLAVKVNNVAKTVARKFARNASELVFSLDAASFKEAYEGAPLNITLTNPDKATVTADVTLSPP